MTRIIVVVEFGIERGRVSVRGAWPDDGLGFIPPVPLHPDNIQVLVRMFLGLTTDIRLQTSAGEGNDA